jgi:hypothetical protein
MLETGRIVSVLFMMGRNLDNDYEGCHIPEPFIWNHLFETGFES